MSKIVRFPGKKVGEIKFTEEKLGNLTMEDVDNLSSGDLSTFPAHNFLLRYGNGVLSKSSAPELRSLVVHGYLKPDHSGLTLYGQMVFGRVKALQNAKT